MEKKPGMSLKKRMIRTNLCMLAAGFLILLAAAFGVALSFKGKLSKEMESLEYTQLDESVIPVAGVMEHAKEGGYEELAAELEKYQYRLAVIRDGAIVYGEDRKDAGEILNHFNFDRHKEEETEIYYSQGMTIVGRHLSAPDLYFFAIDG